MIYKIASILELTYAKFETELDISSFFSDLNRSRHIFWCKY